MKDVVSGFKQYNTVTEQINQKLAERKKRLTEKQKLSPLQLTEKRRLNARIAELTEDLEELKSEKEQVMTISPCSVFAHFVFRFCFSSCGDAHRRNFLIACSGNWGNK